MAKPNSRHRNGLLDRVWDSPTLTTWASFGVRSLGLVIVLPLVLRQFTPEEVALWQVFSMLIGLQLIADLGFGGTFARLVAYAMGGATSIQLGEIPLEVRAKANAPNWLLMGRICATMRAIYRRLSLLLLTILGLGGTWFVTRPIMVTQSVRENLFTGLFSNTHQGWVAWLIVALTTVIVFCFNGYSAYLQGTNHIALLRRWETLFGLGAIISSMLVLMLDGGVLGFVAANQGWALAGAWRNWRLARRVCDGRWCQFPAPQIEDTVFETAWPQAWRSALGTFSTTGFVLFSGLLYAQTSDSVAIASYLLGLRLIQMVNQAAQAPFYSKIPALTQLWTQGKFEEMNILSQRGMWLAYWAFVIPFLLLGVFGPILLVRLGSQTPFPDMQLWILLGFAFFFERYGAMHLQWYSITGDIRWHIVNGITGAIFCILAIVLYPKIGISALPLGMLLGYLGFYGWYSAKYSHRAFHLNWPKFDLATAGGPLLCMLVYTIYALIH